jgi:hypothetical protein
MEFDLDKLFDEMFSIITPDVLSNMNDDEYRDLLAILGTLGTTLGMNLRMKDPNVKLVRSGKYFQYPEWFKAKYPERFKDDCKFQHNQ